MSDYVNRRAARLAAVAAVAAVAALALGLPATGTAYGAGRPRLADRSYSEGDL